MPTIVFGYFALTFFTPEILRGLFSADVNIFNVLAAGIVMGFMIVPTVASVAEDAMSAVPQSLREGAFGLGASKLNVSMRVVFPAALSGIVAALVLGVSRAIGETMIVLIAAGQIASTSLDPREPHYSLASFIGATAKGDVPTGSTEYKTIFAVGMLLFVAHADHEPDLDPLRAEVPAGVRVSAHGSAIGKASASQRAKDTGFRLAMLACLGLSVGLLALLLYDVVKDGASHLTIDFLTSFGSISADKAGAEAAIWGTIWIMVVCAVFIVPVGVATAIYLEEYADNTRWWNRADRGEHPEPASVPSIVYGILGLAFLVRGPLSLGPVVLAGGLMPRPAGAPGGHHRLARGDPGGAALDPRGLAGARRHPVADDPPPGAARLDPRDRHRRDPGPLARDRRDCSSDRARRGHGRSPSTPRASTRRFTALPIQIFDWISRASNDVNNYKPLAAAAILFLMILLLLMNSVAIWLRNRYEQKW